MIRALDLLPRYKAFLLDAYGVLVTSSGALPGAQAFINELRRRNLPFLIVTNDASRLPESAADYYARSGLTISVDQVLTAGLTIGPALARVCGAGRSLQCLVLGTADTRAYVERAGHRALDLSLAETADFDAVIVGDDSGFDFLPTLNAVLTGIHRRVRAGQRPALLLANSDVIYPRSNHAYGFTSGAITKLLEAGLAQLHPNEDLRFEVIGKPAGSFFRAALERGGFDPRTTLMVGDQLHTDIAGARAAQLDCALIRPEGEASLPTTLAEAQRPTYLLASLE